MDPRVKTTHEDLAKQFTVSMKLHDMLQKLAIALEELRGIKSSLQADDKFGKDLSEMEGDEDEDQPTLARVQSNVRSLFDNIQSYDGAPTAQQIEAVTDVEPKVKDVLARWETLRKRRASAAGSGCCAATATRSSSIRGSTIRSFSRTGRSPISSGPTTPSPASESLPMTSRT
jgi:hypothetical protein